MDYSIELELYLCRRAFFDKRLSQEVVGDALGEVKYHLFWFDLIIVRLSFWNKWWNFVYELLLQEFKGYIFKIMGGCDKQGFPMKQGVLTPGRVRLLLHRGNQPTLLLHIYIYIVLDVFFTLSCNGWAGTPCFRGHGRRTGERRRKSVRGCIVSPDLSVLNLVIVKKGENDLPGLTDTEKPRMRGPKRASKIRKLFNLKKEDDVRTYVNTYRRKFTNKKGERIHWNFRNIWNKLEKWWSLKLVSFICFILQVRKWAKPPRSRGLWLHWLFRGREPESLTRRRELLRPILMLLSTRSFLPQGWRNSVTGGVRVWQRRGLDYLLLLPSPLLQLKKLGNQIKDVTFLVLFSFLLRHLKVSSSSYFNCCSMTWVHPSLWACVSWFMLLVEDHFKLKFCCLLFSVFDQGIIQYRTILIKFILLINRFTRWVY